MLHFIFVLLWNSILTALSFCPHRKPISFPSGQNSAFYMLPHVVGTAKWYQPEKAALPNPSQANCQQGKKVGRNLLLLFKCCSHSLSSVTWSTGGGTDILLSPPFVLPLPRLLSKELLLCSLEQRGCDSWQTSCQLLRSGGSHYFLLPHCSVVLG